MMMTKKTIMIYESIIYWTRIKLNANVDMMCAPTHGVKWRAAFLTRENAEQNIKRLFLTIF